MTSLRLSTSETLYLLAPYPFPIPYLHHSGHHGSLCSCHIIYLCFIQPASLGRFQAATWEVLEQVLQRVPPA